jgi:hypothetical protein
MTTRVSAERWHKNRWCRIFGHKRAGYMGGTPYARLEQGPTDGTDTVHMHLVSTCDRCKKRIILCNFHLPSRWRDAVRLPNSPLVLTREGK